jgi:hypothetical protein
MLSLNRYEHQCNDARIDLRQISLSNQYTHYID